VVKEEELQIDPTEEPEDEEQDIIKYQITYYPSDLTLKGYKDKWDSGQLEIPAFQRDFVWDQVRASKLIESFLLGLPVPGVFLYKMQKTNKLQVIDGQQRILSAIRYFEGRFDDKIFRLKKVHPRWEGKTYDELSEPDQFQLQDAVLRATIVQQLDPADNSSIYHIFERLNTGGINLSPMEIRKCVYSSPYFSLLEELNTDDAWRAILGREKPDKRLRDAELVLRVLAMMHSWRSYDKPMKAFLNNYMAGRKAIDETDQTSIRGDREAFSRVCRIVVEALKPKPFHLRGRLNLGVMDSVMTMASRIADDAIEDFARRFDSLISDEQYIKDVTINTSDTQAVMRRFQLAERILLG
jgi:hypothetical protein